MFQVPSYSKNFWIKLICDSYLTPGPAVKVSMYADESAPFDVAWEICVCVQVWTEQHPQCRELLGNFETGD